MIRIHTSYRGKPICPWCETEVEKQGQFCSENCWSDFHDSLIGMAELLDMKYLELAEQPWYTRFDNG